jgi:glutaredoxin
MRERLIHQMTDGQPVEAGYNQIRRFKTAIMHTHTDLRAGKLTVYGSDGCSWTKKQLAYLDKKGLPYTYVNCDNGQCPKSVDSFPTLDIDGKIKVGYTEL